MDRSLVEGWMKDRNIPSPLEKCAILEEYSNGVLDWNDKVNLTAIRDEDEFTRLHILDSLACADLPEWKDRGRILDMGTGAGFPGVPLAVLCPERDFVLADSLAKRVRVIQALCGELGIDNVRAVHGRAEELARQPEYRESFDFCVSRAVAPLNILAELTLPFLSPGGMLAAYKGEEAKTEEEILGAQRALQLLGGRFERTVPVMREYGLDRRIVLIRKEQPTPERYPRRSGAPAKKPL